MSGIEFGKGWVDRRTSRRRFLGFLGISAAMAATGVGGSIALEELVDFIANLEQGDLGRPREGGETLELKLSPRLNNLGELVGPFVRKGPTMGAEELTPLELQQKGIDVTETLRGIKVWGGSYPGPRGLAREEKGRYYGAWTKIINSEGETIGYVAENFVTYLPKAPQE